MLALLSGAVWAGLVLYLLSRALRQFRAHRTTTLAAPAEPIPAAPVSIIVPARNEIDNIETCLRGLTAQTGLPGGFSIIVVDDGSEDGTAAAVERQIGRGCPIELVAAGALPDGWVGKPHACWRGALWPRAAGSALSTPMFAPPGSWSPRRSMPPSAKKSTCCRFTRSKSSAASGSG